MAENKENDRTPSPLPVTPTKSSFSTPKKKRLPSENEPLDDESEEYSMSSDELMIDENPGPSGKVRRPRRIKTKEATRQFVSEGLEGFEDQIEQQLGSKAKKSKLTIGNVKNILKHVITNQHVLAMVKKSMREEGDEADSSDDEEFPFEPKLTRAKTKELLMTQAPMPWPVTPVKAMPGSATKKLIDQVAEDSTDDEEYQPNEDEAENSDDECNSSLASDIEPALTPTHLTPRSNTDCSTQTTWTDDGLFKMPNTNFELMETIGMRTRSKVSLTDTALETIEQSFIPPDITTDMYETECDNEDWKQFLHQFVQPLNSVSENPDDEEADPEYNILEDEEAEDQEELRADRAVKVSKKELNELISELMDFMEPSDDENEAETSVANTTAVSETVEVSISNTVSVVQTSPQVLQITTLSPNPFLLPGTPPSLKATAVVINTSPEPAKEASILPSIEEQGLVEEYDNSIPIFTVEQRLLLNQQMMQHTQLLAQNYMQCTINPDMQLQAQEMKENLVVLKTLGGTNPSSGFYAQNLSPLLKTVEDWDEIREKESIVNEMKEFFNKEKERSERMRVRRLGYAPRLNAQFLNIVSCSRSFVYPTLLPHCGFHPNPLQNHQAFLNSEDQLIAQGLEQFFPYLRELEGEKKATLTSVCQLIGELMLPVKSAKAIVYRVKFAKQFYTDNPITEFYKTNKSPGLLHKVFPVKFVAPSQQPVHLLPPVWKAFIHAIKE